MTELEKLFYLCGISADYLDYGGQRREVPLGDVHGGSRGSAAGRPTLGPRTVGLQA